ncbi:hypothetical protein D3C86_1890090 [compost metagenome]
MLVAPQGRELLHHALRLLRVERDGQEDALAIHGLAADQCVGKVLANLGDHRLDLRGGNPEGHALRLAHGYPSAGIGGAEALNCLSSGGGKAS